MTAITIACFIQKMVQKPKLFGYDKGKYQITSETGMFVRLYVEDMT